MVDYKLSLLAFTIISIVLVSLTLYLVSVLFRVDVLVELSKVKLSILTLSYILFILSLIVGGFRFYFLSRTAGGSLGVKGAILARLGGMFIAFITPFYAGGEPVRIYALKKNGLGWGKSFEVVILEVIFDVYVHNTLTLTLLAFTNDAFKPVFVPILLVSIATLAFWSIPTLILLVGVEKLGRTIEKLGLSKTRTIKELIRAVKGVKGESSLKNMRSVVTCLFLTIISTISGFLSLHFSLLAVDASVTTLKSLRAYAYSMSMGSIPTPGGVGGVEYALLTLIPVKAVVAWRIVSYYLILPLLLVCLIGYVGLEFLKRK